MKKYTKEQLIIAMHRWNMDYDSNPDKFDKDVDYSIRETAERQVKDLLSYL